MRLSSLSEAVVHQLTDRLAKGDRGALDELFQAFGGIAFSISLRVLKNRAEAEEIVQETFLEIWRRATQFSPERSAFAAWVATIARTRAIDRHRMVQSRDRTAEAHGREDQPVVVTPLENVMTARNAERVHGALQQLPPEQREVIELAYFDGLSQQAISERTRTPLGTVKTRARLGSRKLADLLGA